MCASTIGRHRRPAVLTHAQGTVMTMVQMMMPPARHRGASWSGASRRSPLSGAPPAPPATWGQGAAPALPRPPDDGRLPCLLTARGLKTGAGASPETPPPRAGENQCALSIRTGSAAGPDRRGPWGVVGNVASKRLQGLPSCRRGTLTQ